LNKFSDVKRISQSTHWQKCDRRWTDDDTGPEEDQTIWEKAKLRQQVDLTWSLFILLEKHEKHEKQIAMGKNNL
jgi:hypothetical protein